MTRGAWRALYSAVLWLALPWVVARLCWRAVREPGYLRGLPERFGRYRERPRKPVIWLHAVSVGETRAAEPLVKALQAIHPECEWVITQMTAAGRHTAASLYGGRATLAWLPYDYPFAVRRFVAHFRPRVGVILETEVWVNLLHECEAAGVPILLANARLSERSALGYRRLLPLARQSFARLAAVAAQTQDDARRLVALGAPTPEVTGNIKFDVEQPASASALAAEFRNRFGARPVLLAASTRDGEEELLLEALERSPLANAIVLVVPRHPQRFGQVAALLERRRVAFVRRSAAVTVPSACSVVLGDSLGEMSAYYAASDVAFIGGSLLPFGAQNLIEACAAGVPVLIGPSTYNFAQAAGQAIACGAALSVRNADELVARARALLDDSGARRAMAAAGLAFCAEHRGATAKVVAICDRLLARDRVSAAFPHRPSSNRAGD